MPLHCYNTITKVVFLSSIAIRLLPSILLFSLSAVQNIMVRAVLPVKPHNVAVFLESFTCASGFSLNMMDTTAGTVANIEVASSGVSTKIIQDYDYHFNM